MADLETSHATLDHTGLTGVGGTPAAADVTFDATGLDNTDATDVQEAIADLDAAITAVTGGSGPGSLLGVTSYAAGADTSYTTNSTTQADIDATNVKVTFTAPASGNVLVRVTCVVHHGEAGKSGYLGLRESTTDIAGKTLVWVGTTYSAISRVWRLTGLSAGSHTYKLAFASDTTSSTFAVLHGPTNGPIVMEVIGA